MTGHPDRVVTVPDQVLTIAKDVALLTQLDAAFSPVDVARDGPLVTFYDRRVMLRSAQQPGLQQHGRDRDDRERHKAIWRN